MTAPMFRVRDALQRQELLVALSIGLDEPSFIERMIEGTLEGEESSLYLAQRYLVAYRAGYYLGRYRGREAAFDAVYGTGAKHVAARTRAQQARKPKKKAKR